MNTKKVTIIARNRISNRIHTLEFLKTSPLLSSIESILKQFSVVFGDEPEYWSILSHRCIICHKWFNPKHIYWKKTCSKECQRQMINNNTKDWHKRHPEYGKNYQRWYTNLFKKPSSDKNSKK